jgi:hypothetical protein
MPALDFLDDPGAFLEVASDHLASDPVLNSVVATIAEQAVADRSPAPAPTSSPG